MKPAHVKCVSFGQIPIFHYMKPEKTPHKCKRCNKNLTDDIICTTCKTELISYYEATGDWMTAYEIEKAQIIASRYSKDSSDDSDIY